MKLLEPVSEEQFVAMLHKPREFARWAELVRKNWTAARARDSAVVGAGRDQTGPFDNPRPSQRRLSKETKR